MEIKRECFLYLFFVCVCMCVCADIYVLHDQRKCEQQRYRHNQRLCPQLYICISKNYIKINKYYNRKEKVEKKEFYFYSKRRKIYYSFFFHFPFLFHGIMHHLTQKVTIYVLSVKPLIHADIRGRRFFTFFGHVLVEEKLTLLPANACPLCL